jgi:hypothetical protein
MISEQTATRTPTSALRAHPFTQTSDLVEPTTTPSTGWRDRLQVLAAQVRTVASALLGAVALGVSPSYFELERHGPIQTRLGPGLSRESDSFWPLSEW